MQRRQLLSLVLSGAVAIGVSSAGFGSAKAETGYRISGPVTHGNLAIYLVHGKSAPGAVPLTLAEAMTTGSVHVHETSNVNELQIENLSDQEIFVQSGDIVKGGKQDRVLMVSLVLPPKSGRMPIASFCVEQGRWQARGQENVSRFASADASLPSRKAKLAMKAPTKAVPAENTGGNPDYLQRPGRIPGGRSLDARQQPGNETAVRQREVWSSVAATQSKLAKGLGIGTVAAPQSASSLQLTIENDQLKAQRAAYVKALGAAAGGDDVVGFVFAINGKLNSADVYPSNGLFKKMWGKLLDAAVTEAIGERDGQGETLPATDAVLAFLTAGEGGTPQAPRELNKAVKLETRENEKTLYFATERTGGGWVHRNYLAK